MHVKYRFCSCWEFRSGIVSRRQGSKEKSTKELIIWPRRWENDALGDKESSIPSTRGAYLFKCHGDRCQRSLHISLNP